MRRWMDETERRHGRESAEGVVVNVWVWPGRWYRYSGGAGRGLTFCLCCSCCSLRASCSVSREWRDFSRPATAPCDCKNTRALPTSPQEPDIQVSPRVKSRHYVNEIPRCARPHLLKVFRHLLNDILELPTSALQFCYLFLRFFSDTKELLPVEQVFFIFSFFYFLLA